MIIVEIAGRLGADPETRYTPNNQKVTTMRVATNLYKGGKEETVWWRVTVWGDRFDRMMNYLKKGSAVIIVGEMHKPEIWNDREGNAQISMEMTAEMIKFSPFGRSDQAGQENTDFQKGSSENSLGASQGDASATSAGGGDFMQETNYSSNVETATSPSGIQTSVDESDDGLPF